MVGIYISGMDADEYYEICKWARIGANNAMIGRKSCIPVPEHGRLIDGDAMQEEWYRLNFDRKISDGTLAYWNYRLSQMPTIIPADKEG